MKRLFSDWQWSPMRIQNIVSVKTTKSPRVYQNRGNTRACQLGMKFTGHSELHYKGVRIDFGPGTVAYLPKEETEQIDYTTLTKEAGNGVCIFFDSELPLPREPQILTGADSETENAFLRVLHVYNRSDRYCHPELMEAFYALLSKLARVHSEGAENDREKRLDPALDYMRRHCGDSYIDLSRVADRCGMSEKYFRDSFQKAFGLAPLQYFHRQKVNHIRTLICDLSLSVSEVSHLSGFSDPNYFSRFFRKHFGVSPTEYRKYYCR